MSQKTTTPKLRWPLQLERNLQTRNEDYFLRRGENAALKLFWAMSKRVPAYGDFLKKNKIIAAKVGMANDLKLVPPIDKQSYLKQYPLEELCWDGNLKKGRWTIASTSGTTGQPFYFPRKLEQNKQYATLAELYLRSNFEIQRTTTLYINGFALGVWIGGLFTHEAISMVASSGNYNLSIINPGLNKTEILKALVNLGHHFDQIIIGGYPPFIKDLVDEGINNNINWKKFNLKFIFSAEGFSESWRDYIIKRVGLKNPYKDTLNHYGTVDLGTMAYETPISILIRRLAVRNPGLYRSLFGQTRRLPTFTQFLPELFYFEEEHGNLLCSANSGLPLVRYDLKDRGGVLNFSEVKNIFNGRDLPWEQLTRDAKIAQTVWPLPFVYLYERSDLAVSWYGANIDPEHIKIAHEHKKLSKFFSGKFTLEIKTDKKYNPLLHVHTELKKGARASKTLLRLLQQEIIKNLLEKNSEYKNNYTAMPNNNTPKVILWAYESHPFFKGGGKQKWSIK